MQKFTFHFFNVNHGDSILVELEVGSEKFYIIVDTYFVKKNNRTVNPALEYLKNQNVSTISSIIITHFHKDHYTGIEDFFDNFEVQKLCLPPVISRNSKSFSRIIEKYKKKIGETLSIVNDNQIFSELRSLIFLIDYMKKNEDKIEEIEGKESYFRIAGVKHDIGTIFLPLARFKGALRNKILNEDFRLDTFPEMNDMSVAICFNCSSNKILLTGDSTLKQWKEHKKRMAKDGVFNLDVNALKSSHHGSKNNNTEELFDYFLSKESKDKHIFVSANGKSHPHDIIFDLINKYHLTPHCTNLATQCFNALDLYPLDPSLINAYPFLMNYRMETDPIPCQGDITLKVDATSVEVTHSTSIKCIYH